MHRPAPALSALALLVLAHPLPAQDKGYYRSPAVSGDRIVFTAEGDLWSVPLGGGVASRLTTHPAEEASPAVSPDGKWIAFSAAYEGPTEVYVMPAGGGLPRRLTYEGDATVTGWTPDGRVAYRSNAFSTLPDAQLVVVDPAIGRQERVPLAQAADGSWDKAGGTLFFSRLEDQGSRTKRYKGGTAQKIWRLRSGASEAEPLTADFDGTSRNPMAWNGRVYFESDRDGAVNLWSMAPDGKDLRQHTRHQGWDVKGASLAGGRIAYQLGADLRLYDIAKNEDREVVVTLASDLDQMRERWVTQPLRYLDAWHVSPSGDRLTFTARGRVFVAPAERGRFAETTRKSSVRYRSARFLPPAGTDLLALSDQSGEVEWWRVSAVGVGDAVQVSKDGKVLRLDGIPSPDGKWIAHWNHDQELWLTEVATGRSTRIAVSPQWGFDRPGWSPDSRWFVYGKPAANGQMQLFLFSMESRSALPLTTDRYNNDEATWSPDGKWIYFLSDRNFQSLVGAPWGSYQPEPFWDRTTRLYAIATQPGLRSPFQPADELVPPDTAAKKPVKPDSAAATPTRTPVDTAGIAARLYQLPVDPGSYSDLAVNEKRLFWIDRETSVKHTASLQALEIGDKKPEVKTIVKDLRGYELSSDGKKLAIRKGDAFYVIDAGAGEGAKLDDGQVDLSGWSFALDPKEDYRQLFVESWRLERDYFYDPGMHGVDWDGMLKKYLPLVDRVRSRGDLADLQSQLAGELSALHTFVFGGDNRQGREDVAVATLGARLTRDEQAGGWRVEHIYRGDPDQPASLSPLARYGVQVREAEVITAMNGVPSLSVAHPTALLRNQAGKQVRLRIKAAGGAERDVIAVPLTAREDFDLRYSEWEYTRRVRVDSASSGRIGYVHLRAMGSADMAQWAREFYPQFDRQALIIDDRHNGGGNIESWILEKLVRRAWMYWQPRVGDPYWNMQYAFRGHVVVLVDEQTGSDGEAFAEGFRRLGLGKVIGTRTWGGEIWLTASNRLNDRGVVTAAEFGVYGPDGKWLIEGRGVEPDSLVDNLPGETFRGRDRQLEAALAHLEGLIRKDPRPLPAHAPYPDKASPDNRRH
jgi:tricorn protease